MWKIKMNKKTHLLHIKSPNQLDHSSYLTPEPHTLTRLKLNNIQSLFGAISRFIFFNWTTYKACLGLFHSWSFLFQDHSSCQVRMADYSSCQERLADMSWLLVFLSGKVGWHVFLSGKVGWHDLLHEPAWSNFLLNAKLDAFQTSHKFLQKNCKQTRLLKRKTIKKIKNQTYTYNSVRVTSSEINSMTR